jgi:hypothetical protein
MRVRSQTGGYPQRQRKSISRPKLAHIPYVATSISDATRSYIACAVIDGGIVLEASHVGEGGEISLSWKHPQLQLSITNKCHYVSLPSHDTARYIL